MGRGGAPQAVAIPCLECNRAARLTRGVVSAIRTRCVEGLAPAPAL
jgi:hypothetical protein